MGVLKPQKMDDKVTTRMLYKKIDAPEEVRGILLTSTQPKCPIGDKVRLQCDAVQQTSQRNPLKP